MTPGSSCQVRVRSLFVHFIQKPALQVCSKSSGQFSKLDAMMALFIGPGYASWYFRLDLGLGNAETKRKRGPKPERLLGGHSCAPEADVQQPCLKLLVGMFHDRGDIQLGAIVALLLQAQDSGRPFNLRFAVNLQF